MSVVPKIREKRKRERKVVRSIISLNKRNRYWHCEKDAHNSFKSLTKIKNRRKVQDLIHSYINKSRFVWKFVKFSLERKNIFQKISPNGRSRTRVDSAPLQNRLTGVAKVLGQKSLHSSSAIT